MKEKKEIWKIGKSYFIRTLEYHMIGKLAKIEGGFLLFENASWVADSGRFMQAIKFGTLNEVEPVKNAIVALQNIIDAFEWKHPLPRDQK